MTPAALPLDIDDTTVRVAARTAPGEADDGGRRADPRRRLPAGAARARDDRALARHHREQIELKPVL